MSRVGKAPGTKGVAVKRIASFLALAGALVLGASGAARSSFAVRETATFTGRLNQHRVAIGCRTLVRDRKLDALALRHSQDMVRRRFFDHRNPDGRDPFERMRAAGIRFRAAAENIAQGQQSGAEVYDAWIHSPGHRRNMEECEYTHFGIAVYRDTWTLELVRYAH